jgi:hypothetical protein
MFFLLGAGYEKSGRSAGRPGRSGPGEQPGRKAGAAGVLTPGRTDGAAGFRNYFTKNRELKDRALEAKIIGKT